MPLACRKLFNCLEGKRSLAVVLPDFTGSVVRVAVFAEDEAAEWQAAPMRLLDLASDARQRTGRCCSHGVVSIADLLTVVYTGVQGVVSAK